MTEQVTETPPAETAAGDTSQEKPEVDWKAKARDWEKRAKANADAATRLAQLEESQKTEAQKLAEAAEQHRTRAEKAEFELVRLRVALKHGIPDDDLDLLVGSSEDEIEAKAQRIAAKNAAAAAASASPRPSGDVGQGTRTTPLNSDSLLDSLKSSLGIP